MANPNAPDMGEALKHARLYAGLDQSDVARQLGMSQNFISNVERGYRTLDPYGLSRWKRMLHIGTNGGGHA